MMIILAIILAFILAPAIIELLIWIMISGFYIGIVCLIALVIFIGLEWLFI